MGDADYGIQPEVISRFAKEIAELSAQGVELGIVIGGGNIFRGAGLAASGMDRVSGDHMGMLATVMNALALQDAIERHGVFCRVMSAIRINEVCEDYLRRRAIRHLEKGRAHTSLLDHVVVPYYGSDVALSQVANVGIEDSRTLTVTPWEKPMLSVIEKAIMTSDLGVNPNSAGMTIRIPIPPLTEERRRDLVKVAKSEAEGARVAIRNIRRDANSTLKELLKEKEISEDEERNAAEAVQRLTDDGITKVDQVLADKETDLMEV
ncbi:UNVERIFIED_CONTAM: hypothetical protein GTU68_010252 [Idotea baltica]|nr:hypothetical protein [Idotea baltica]